MKTMKKKKGFTLVELMVVVLIVGILASVAIPLMRGRVDSAKWSEGKAAAGTIATALRAYAAEKGDQGTYPPSLSELGFTDSDLHGTYFDISNYAITSATFTPTGDPELEFVITVTNTALAPNQMALTVDATNSPEASWSQVDEVGGG